MAFVPSASIAGVVLLNGVDLSPWLKSIKPTGNADLKESTSLADTGSKQYLKGLMDRGVSASGFFKRSANVKDNVDNLFNTALGDTSGDYLLAVGPEGGSSGSPAMFGNVKSVKYDVDTTVGEILMTAFEAKGSKSSTSQNLFAGVWLGKGVFTTGSTNGTSVDNAASTTGYVVQVNGVDGDNTVSVQLQHSTNNSTWVNLGSAIVVGANAASQVLDTVTSVNRYVRAVITPAGTTNTVGVVIKLGYTG